MFGAANTSLTQVYMIWRSSGRQYPSRRGVGGAAASSDVPSGSFTYNRHTLMSTLSGARGTPHVYIYIYTKMYIHTHGASLCTRSRGGSGEQQPSRCGVEGAAAPLDAPSINPIYSKQIYRRMYVLFNLYIHISSCFRQMPPPCQ